MSYLDEYGNEIRSMYESGKTMQYIAKKFNSSINTVSRILHRLGVDVRSTGRQRNEGIREKAEFLIEEYNSGKSIKEVSEESGISYGTVRRILLENGVKMRKTH